MDTPRYPRPEVLGRIPLDRSTVIEASAGTGKTYTLEHLVVEILLRTETRIEEILAVTFTEKATTELRTRIREKLEELLAHTDQSAELPDETVWSLDDAARARLTRALLGLDQANISTIHAFCHRVLTEHAFANGRLFGEEQVDGREAFRAAFCDVLRAEFARRPAMQAYLEAWLDAGRTVDDLESLLYECASRTGRKVPAFSESAFADVVGELTFGAAALAWAEAELLAAKCNTRSIPKVLRCLTLLADAVEQGRRRGPAAFIQAFDAVDAGYLSGILRKIQGRSARLDALCASLETVNDAAVPLAAAMVSVLLDAVVHRLEQRKRELGHFDFDDMLRLVEKSLTPEGGLIELLRTRYRYALIDEFQDTDEVQWNVFRQVFLESDRNFLFLIGDPKQAIYGFRGGDVHTYLKARSTVLAGRHQAVELDRNFRSTAEVITAYNRVFHDGAADRYFGGGITYEAPVSCGNPKLRLVDKGGNSAPVHLLHLVAPEQKFKSEPARCALEARIAREIERLLDPERAVELVDEKDGVETRRLLRPQDIYVLTRTAKEGYRIGEALREVGIPHAFYKQDGLYQTPEAADVRDLLRAVADPRDLQRRMQAWLSPFFGVPLKDLERTRDLDGSHPLMSRLLEWHALAEARAWHELFSRLVSDSGIVRRELFWSDSERALTNYLHLLELLLEETGRSGVTLEELVGRLDARIAGRAAPEGESGNTQRLETERQAVQIMTMHKSKGLEAAVVFVAGGFTAGSNQGWTRLCHQEDERLVVVGAAREPYKTLCDQEEEEEGQRLMYVALTRAKARLYLPYFGPRPQGEDPCPGEADSKRTFSVSGCYRPVHDRLIALLEGGDSEVERLFHREEVPVGVAGPEASGPREAPLTWTPPPDVLEEPDPQGFYAGLRRQHGGFVVTSFSRLNPHSGALQPAPEETDQRHDEAEAVAVASVEDDLPGGLTTGLFLHQILEKVPLTPAQPLPAFEEWRRTAEVARVVETALQEHGIDPRHRPRAEALVHTALTAPIDVGGGRIVPCIAPAARVLRESKFLYPIPEQHHPRLDEIAALPGVDIHRGYITGVVDLIFEHEGRVYVADWKSNKLGRWDRAAVAACVADSYALQSRLYTLALVRMLRLNDRAAYERRFGGVLYLFLRGMQADGDGTGGVHFTLPSWDEVLAWDEQLRRPEAFVSAGVGGLS